MKLFLLIRIIFYFRDVELGRCVRKYAGIACTWNYEMQLLFHNNQTGIPNLQDTSNNNKFHKFITLHPIKQPGTMRKIHHKAMSLKLNELRQKKINLIKELQDFFMKKDGQQNALMRRVANTTTDLQSWEYLLMNKIAYCANQMNCPRHTIDMATMNSIKQIVNEVCLEHFYTLFFYT